MRRAVVYAGTRNLYKNMVTSAKSLLMHTRVDRVYFLIEDDEFPEPLPGVVKCFNVSGQKWFDPAGPNFGTRWTYMTLIRLALPEILPGEDRVLWLDVDTIVNRDIGELLDTDMAGCYVAAAEEPIRCKPPFRYFNAGVLLMDLEQLRDGKYWDLITLVNERKMDFPDQDAINLLCQTRILEISPTYNSNKWITEVTDPAITHFAANRRYTEDPLWQRYEHAEWRDSDAYEA